MHSALLTRPHPGQSSSPMSRSLSTRVQGAGRTGVFAKQGLSVWKCGRMEEDRAALSEAELLILKEMRFPGCPGPLRKQ